MGDTRPMKMEALAVWDRDCRDNTMALRRSLGVADEGWLKWVAPLISADDVGLLCAEPVLTWDNIAAALRRSRRFAIALPSDLLTVNHNDSRVWTSLSEIWHCRCALSSGAHLASEPANCRQ
jgi:hypothetical protein